MFLRPAGSKRPLAERGVGYWVFKLAKSSDDLWVKSKRRSGNHYAVTDLSNSVSTGFLRYELELRSSSFTSLT